MKESAYALDKEYFLEKYQIRDTFKKSRLRWGTLDKIYQAYVKLKSSEEFQKTVMDFEAYCRDIMKDSCNIHSIRCRPKDPEHLIEKIIRKRGEEQNSKYKGISYKNYNKIVRDLIGLRVLVYKKEDWEFVFDKIAEMFPGDIANAACMAEPTTAYIRYGDRDIYKDKIHLDYSNRGYRSQHYIVRFNGVYCEIQSRTLAEEVFGEFDHIVKYPYRMDNNFLKRYTNTVSKLTDSIDEMMSTCFQLEQKGWAACDAYFDEDQYCDWGNTNQVPPASKPRKSGDKSGGNKSDSEKAIIKNLVLREEDGGSHGNGK